MSLPPPPPSPKVNTFSRPVVKRSRFGIVPVLLLAAATVGVLVWGLTGPSVLAPRTPASRHVDVEPQPLTQAGADAAAGAVLVAFDDADQLNFVAWDIHRMTGCWILAVLYQGPTGSTDPRSIPDDIQPDVIGRAHRGGERITVWFGCERGTK